MGMARAQLLVWMLIFGLGAAGSAVLSRVTLPEDVFAAAPAARPAALPATAVKEQLPATIPVFPFPDELATAAVADEPVAVQPPKPVVALLDIPAGPVRDIAAAEVSMVTTESPPVPAAARPRQVTAAPVGGGTLYVMADALNVRATPSSDGAVLQKLALGFAVEPQQRSEEWVGFRLKDGSTGWLSAEYLSASKPAPAPVAAEAPVVEQPMNLM